MEYTETPRPKEEVGKRLSRVITVVCAAVMLMAVSLAVLLFVQNHSLKTSKHSTTTHQVSNDDVIKRVSLVYDAPTEKPSVAQVGDKSKLAGQPFFTNAEKGDYILIYPNARIALIYRLSTNRVINIGPISTSSTQN